MNFSLVCKFQVIYIYSFKVNTCKENWMDYIWDIFAHIYLSQIRHFGAVANYKAHNREIATAKPDNNENCR